jgi:enamine deaminase RidA (YjgF/YER057c/UK114 family)
MLKSLLTDRAPPPFSAYSQAVEVSVDSRLVFVSGQVGANADGSLVADEAGQHEQCWGNILAILAAGGLGAKDIVAVEAFVTTQSGVALYRETRDRMLKGARPASTLLIVAGLADPNWLVEISVVAAAGE